MDQTLFLQIITIISLIIITSIIVKRAFYMSTIKRDPIRAFFPWITEPGRVLINKRTGEVKDDKSWVKGEPLNAKHWTEEIKEEIKEKRKHNARRIMASTLYNENDELDIKLNPKQSIIWNSIFNPDMTIKQYVYREFSYWGAYRCGKSLIYMMIACVLCKNYASLNLLYCRATYGELEDSVIKQFRELFPEHKAGYKYKIQKREAIFDTGSVINFRAFDKDTKILSTEFDAAFFCQSEEIPHRLFLQLMGRLSGRKLPKNFLFVEGNPEDDCWPKERYKNDDNVLPNDCLYVEGEMRENKENLPPDYIETLEREYPQDWINKYIYGRWDIKVGRVYDELKAEIHIVEPFKIPEHWYRIIGFDHGTKNPSAMNWLCVDEIGRIFIYDEYYEKGKHNYELAAANKKNGIYVSIGDTSMKVKTSRSNGTWGSVWDDLVEDGIRLVEATKDKKANILLVNKFFKQNRLFIFDTCLNTIREHRKYRYKPVRPGKEENHSEEVIKSNDHTCDAVQYAIRYLKDKKVTEPTPYPKEQTLEYHVHRFDQDLSINNG